MHSPPPPSRTPLEPAPGPDEPARPDIPPWPLWTLPAAFALGLGLTILLQGVVAVAARAGGSSISHPSTAVNLALDVTTDGGFVAAVLYFTIWQGRSRATDFGYRRVYPA